MWLSPLPLTSSWAPLPQSNPPPSRFFHSLPFTPSLSPTTPSPPAPFPHPAPCPSHTSPLRSSQSSAHLPNPPLSAHLLPFCFTIPITMRTPCIGLAPSAMARMTAVAMLLLLGLLLALALATAMSFISIMLLGRDASYRAPVTADHAPVLSFLPCCVLQLPRDNDSQQVNPLMLASPSILHANATATSHNSTCGPSTHANAIATSPQRVNTLNVPLHSLDTLVASSVCDLFCDRHSHGTAVGDGRDTHASQSMGASAGLGCDGWADEAEECNQVPPGMPCALPSATAASPSAKLSYPSWSLSLPFSPSCSHSSPCSFVFLPIFSLVTCVSHAAVLCSSHLSSSSLLLSIHQSSCLPFLAITMLQPCGNFPLLHSPMSGTERLGKAVGTVVASMAGTQELKDAMEMRMRVMEEAERRQVAQMNEMRGQMEERERKLIAELAAVKAELIGVKGELADHKGAVTEKLDMAERRRAVELRELREEARKGEDEMRADLAREREERRREVQEVERRRASDLTEMKGQMEEREKEPAAVKDELAEQKHAHMQMDVDLKIIHCEGHQKFAWKVSAEPS
ncbi:unnamed protein product [Closterium sp. NIES-65]|nr:unnamed protein product [Closterium sp. NIES-65]